MTVPIYQVDAFTNRPFGGNPAAVCRLDIPTGETWMQKVAAEMNLAETAFISPKADGFGLRWFTPVAEVDLCGHATLASAHVLWQTGSLEPSQAARFHTKSGLLTAERIGEWIQLDFPATPAEPADPPEGLLEALGVLRAEFVGRSRFDLLVVLGNEEEVESLEPDFEALAQIEARGVIATARSTDDRYDFVSRFFAPRLGVPEDPATGSSHCALAPYWAKELGKDEMTGFQASRRQGVIRVRPAGERVKLLGQAVTILRGELTAGDGPAEAAR